MVLEDIKYQLDQFYSFENIKLSFEILDKQGVIYFSGGKILHAFLGTKQDIDVFKELNGLDAPINIQVSIGESSPEITLDKYLDEIIQIINEDGKGSDSNQKPNNAKSSDTEIVKNYTESSPALVVKIAETLSVINGVESILAVKEDGEVLYSKGIDDTDFESADALFLFNQSKELGDILNFNKLKSAICEANNYKKIIINNKNVLYSLKVSSEVPALKTQMEAIKLLKEN
ncbi:MAG: hypothetical protein EVJ48_02000 [Candidatus Acidulodesulfobacterium acidiphilum]|uniref:Roadblock/LC7 domain-containing protein n=1 Tax=Candidatus Acidulodesulfobacterium acidiphilum TaxID=2597224 RepID=A0A520XGG1_9DELT|nr:MAG: hypothetical protein EVJ48_02000 [Candidatus Acidulodesulfobacterium acidiphilum]